MPKSAGPEGVGVTRVADAGARGVQKAPNELVNAQRVVTDDIIVLTGRSRENSSMQEGQTLGYFGLTWLPPMRGEVQAATVHSFKGGKGVVILAELEGYFQERRDVGSRSSTSGPRVPLDIWCWWGRGCLVLRPSSCVREDRLSCFPASSSAPMAVASDAVEYIGDRWALKARNARRSRDSRFVTVQPECLSGYLGAVSPCSYCCPRIGECSLAFLTME